MPNCSVRGCHNRTDRKSDKRISFHRFPKDQLRLSEWLKAIHREAWEPSKYAVICSEHFSEESFNRSGNETRLHSHAVPFIIMQECESQQREVQEEIMSLEGMVSPDSRPGTSFTYYSSESQVIFSPDGTNVHTALPMQTSFETPRKRKLKSRLELARKKIKYLQQRNRRHKKSLNNVQDMLKHLRRKNLIDDSGMDILSSIKCY